MASAWDARVDRFGAYAARKGSLAARAVIPGYTTVCECAPLDLIRIGGVWTERVFDGPFYRSPPARPDAPAVSLVFVQSKDGNTVAPDPSTLGGGETDAHLIYEGLSRVDADAVLAGAATARGEEMVFSVWHPELVRLRLERGRTRHPAQVIVTGKGELAIERALIFQVPELPVYLITRSRTVMDLRDRVRSRPWITVIDGGEPISLTRALGELHARGLEVVSAIGGRRTATALLNERLVSDIYLTTSPREGGEPDTPFYDGPPLSTRTIVEKAGLGPEEGVRFEHLVIR